MQLWRSERLQELCSVDIGISSTRILSVVPVGFTSGNVSDSASESLEIHVVCNDGIYVVIAQSLSPLLSALPSPSSVVAAAAAATENYSSQHTPIITQSSQNKSAPSSQSFTRSYSASPNQLPSPAAAPSVPFVKDSSTLLIPKLSASPVTHPCIGDLRLPQAMCFCVCDCTVVVGMASGGFVLMTTLLTDARDASVKHEHPVALLESCRLGVNRAE